MTRLKKENVFLCNAKIITFDANFIRCSQRNKAQSLPK
jgi:hypothetical protein